MSCSVNYLAHLYLLFKLDCAKRLVFFQRRRWNIQHSEEGNQWFTKVSGDGALQRHIFMFTWKWALVKCTSDQRTNVYLKTCLLIWRRHRYEVTICVVCTKGKRAHQGASCVSLHVYSKKKTHKSLLFKVYMSVLSISEWCFREYVFSHFSKQLWHVTPPPNHKNIRHGSGGSSCGSYSPPNIQSCDI